ncbi:hypothetical protein AND4_17524 [Vibrio sp. AND4]|nr:hypothetical protein AND4_17524 [Vibrio sp. AND4]
MDQAQEVAQLTGSQRTVKTHQEDEEQHLWHGKLEKQKDS